MAASAQPSTSKALRVRQPWAPTLAPHQPHIPSEQVTGEQEAEAWQRKWSLGRTQGHGEALSTVNRPREWQPRHRTVPQRPHWPPGLPWIFTINPLSRAQGALVFVLKCPVRQHGPGEQQFPAPVCTVRDQGTRSYSRIEWFRSSPSCLWLPGPKPLRFPGKPPGELVL